MMSSKYTVGTCHICPGCGAKGSLFCKCRNTDLNKRKRLLEGKQLILEEELRITKLKILKQQRADYKELYRILCIPSMHVNRCHEIGWFTSADNARKYIPIQHLTDVFTETTTWIYHIIVKPIEDLGVDDVLDEKPENLPLL